MSVKKRFAREDKQKGKKREASACCHLFRLFDPCRFVNGAFRTKKAVDFNSKLHIVSWSSSDGVYEASARQQQWQEIDGLNSGSATVSDKERTTWSLECASPPKGMSAEVQNVSWTFESGNFKTRVQEQKQQEVDNLISGLVAIGSSKNASNHMIVRLRVAKDQNLLRSVRRGDNYTHPHEVPSPIMRSCIACFLLLLLLTHPSILSQERLLFGTGVQ